MAQLAIQNGKDRHTRHLKKEEVGVKTMQMQESASKAKLSLQSRDLASISFMETFTGDPIKQAYDSRRGLHTAREQVTKDFS